jgi:formylglycine-generating enzyme required for sulfatase activity
VRSYLIARLGPGGVEARALLDLLAREKEVSVRRALLLALGEYDANLFPPGQREPLIPGLVALYREDPDPGMHGAAGWLLGQWGQGDKLREVDRSLAGKVEGGRKWFVNGQGQTLVVLPPGMFLMGESAWQKQRHIDHSFGLAAREVTVAEFLLFRKEHQNFQQFAPTLDCPVNGVSWYDAAAYCNWLSEKEGIPKEEWCYLPNDKGQYAAGMKVPADYLRRTGYRLPTSEEWEYACRAGSTTGWSMGDAEDLLRRYAWYVANANGKSHPTGSLRPSDWGLFDMHGNAYEWCQDRVLQGGDKKDKEDIEFDKDQNSRLSRGGSFRDLAWNTRPTISSIRAAADCFINLGFRPARTFR